MRLTDMEVHVPQVAQLSTDTQQLVQVEAELNMDTKSMAFHWYNFSDSGERLEDFYASATMTFEDPEAWQTEWSRVEHLVKGRIESLKRMAIEGTANKMSKNMVYKLFENCVLYGEEWRGMDTIVLDDREAFCEVTLLPNKHEDSHSPAPWIDSACHIAGWICNGGDASNTKDYFYVTDHMGSWRMSKPMKAGDKYTSYVRMFPAGENNHWIGDVYMLQDGVVIGMVEQISFHGLPRKLLDFFMSPPEVKAKNGGSGQHTGKPAVQPPPKLTVVAAKSAPGVEVANPNVQPVIETIKPVAAVETEKMNPLIADCLKLIANESGMELAELTDDRLFVEIGCDSLMSLVLSEKFRKELRLDVKSSIFIECPTIGELKGWLEQYS